MRTVTCAASAALIYVGAVHASPHDGHMVQFYLGGQSSYDDNLYRLPGNLTDLQAVLGPRASREDRIDTASAGLDAKWTAGLQTLAVGARADYNRFNHSDALDNASGDGKLEWGWRVADAWSGRVGANYDRALASFANNRFLGKDLLDTSASFGEIDWQIGSHWIANASARHTTAAHSAVSRNIDDYHSNSGAFGIDYTTAIGNLLGWEYVYANGRYPNEIELRGLPFDRGYDEHTASFHVTYRLTGKTTFQGRSGYLKRTYPNASLGGFSGGVWRASLEWQASTKTQVIVSGWHELTAYIDAQSDYFVTQGVSVAPVWAPTHKVSVSLQFSRDRENHIGSNLSLPGTITRRDTVTSGKFTMAWKPTRALELDLSYRLERRDSDIAVLAYDDHVANLGLRLTL
jgi:exopolysaccharide biosynthesis operon protein EpsL